MELVEVLVVEEVAPVVEADFREAEVGVVARVLTVAVEEEVVAEEEVVDFLVVVEALGFPVVVNNKAVFRHKIDFEICGFDFILSQRKD